MYKRFAIRFAVFASVAVSVSAQQYQRRAVVTGGGNSGGGKCTIEVVVDGVAEVEVRGDNATLRNVSGQPPQWRRFECTGVMPANPPNFRFAGVDGRGRQELVSDPRNGGIVVVRVEDHDGGAEGYTFDLIWGGGSGFSSGREGERQNAPNDRPNAPNDRPNAPNYERQGIGRDPRYGERDRLNQRQFSTDQAVRVCQDAIRQ